MNRPNQIRPALLALALAICIPVTSAWIAGPSRAANEPALGGRVVRVIDGDTVEIDLVGRTIRVRLAEIDAPERDQPHGPEATAALRERIEGKRVRLVIVDTDRYGRTVAEIHRGDLHVNQDMVRAGHAWAYTKYARTTEIIALEDEARAAGRGLWALPPNDREPPWEWRRRKQRGTSSSRPPASSSATEAESSGAVPPSGECGAKRKCGEMTSCAEAIFYLEDCGLTRLDRDGDGVPCESLCR